MNSMLQEMHSVAFDVGKSVSFASASGFSVGVGIGVSVSVSVRSSRFI